MIVLVTGATGGLGQVLSESLRNAGHTVYGTTRNLQSVAADHPATLLEMEATNDSSVKQCIDQVIKNEGRIDAVVNCLNQMFIGSVEETTVDEVTGMYDTNLFSVIRICQHVLPHMRQQGHGTIVNMSSLGGLLAVPLMSSYTSAKFALEAFSEALYHEVKPDNIDVVIMQPVAMHMERPESGNHLHVVPGAKKDSKSYRMLKRMAKDTAASKLTPEMVSEKIIEVLAMKSKPLRVPMDKARIITLIKRLVPQSVINKLVRGLV